MLLHTWNRNSAASGCPPTIRFLHDDPKHRSTAICRWFAAVRNAAFFCRLKGKRISRTSKIVRPGARRATRFLPHDNMLLNSVVQTRERPWLCDIPAWSITRAARSNMKTRIKSEICAKRQICAPWADVIPDAASFFPRLSRPRRAEPLKMVQKMTPQPSSLALANPRLPEIHGRSLRAPWPPDEAIGIARAGSDLSPNQVNNVLVLPFIFRGGTGTSGSKGDHDNDEMKIACIDGN